MLANVQCNTMASGHGLGDGLASATQQDGAALDGNDGVLTQQHASQTTARATPMITILAKDMRSKG